jgi:hypothetical protein
MTQEEKKKCIEALDDIAEVFFDLELKKGRK